MIMEALIVGFVCMFGKFFDWYGSIYASRPIVTIALLGFLLGHPVEGIIMGATVELAFLGTVSLGGVIPQDYVLGPIIGGAFALILGRDAATAITLAIPISMLGVFIYSCFKITATSLVPRFDKYAEEGNVVAFKRLWMLQFIGFNLLWFLLGFVVIMVGTDAVNALVDALPKFLQASMNVAAGMLPALGMALLLKTLWNKEVAPYYFVGFALAAFFGGTLINIAFVGAVVAVIVVMGDLKMKSQPVGTDKNVSVEEDFFND